MEYYEQPEDIEFFEEVETPGSDRYNHHEKLEYQEKDGLSQEGVQKLSEDFFNPLPPSNDQE